jgi:phosphate:Na+ symporter
VSGTLILVELAGQVGLLLWGTHMVSTGVQRGFGSALRQALERNLVRRWQAFLTGLGITTLLQSSTATGLMATSFTAAGVIALAPALAVMLGANVGTALITQVLSFNAGLLAPPLVLLGVLLFRWSEGSRFKNVGRAAIGIGLMLMALAGLQHTLAPVENTPLLRSLLESLGGEPLLAIAVAFVLTWGCHSSVAIVLVVASLAASHVVGPTESLALVLGANLGGAMPALLHASAPAARRLPLGNLLVRFTGVLLALPWLAVITRWIHQFAENDGRLVVDFHLLFNLVVALLFLPFVDQLGRGLGRLLPDAPQSADPGRSQYLESSALDTPSVALANATRETLRVADMLEAMLRGALDMFRARDRAREDDISAADRAVQQLGGSIRGYLVVIGSEQTLDDAREGARLQEILSAVINLEHISDIIANSLMEFAVRQSKRGQPLSPDEFTAVASMHAELLESLKLAMAVFIHRDAGDARRLVERKARLRQMESDATALSVQLLREATTSNRGAPSDGVAVADESGTLLRIVRDLRRIHSHLASFAYPVVHRARPRRRFRSRIGGSKVASTNEADAQAPDEPAPR